MPTPPTEILSEPLPSKPLQLVSDWLAYAWQQRQQPNPNAMVLATVAPDGRPSARVVLCKEIVPEPGYVVFYTNYLSRKGKELAANPRAAIVMHWDALHRQVRVEGVVVRGTAEESDAYFASRALESRIGAWASAQSEPVASRAELLAAVDRETARFEGSNNVPRPPHWGGYRLWADSVELWVEGDARIHDRARWTRPLKAVGEDRFEPGPWSATRLQP